MKSFLLFEFDLAVIVCTLRAVFLCTAGQKVALHHIEDGQPASWRTEAAGWISLACFFAAVALVVAIFS